MSKLLKKTMLSAVLLIGTVSLVNAQRTAVKSNIFYWGAAGSPNLAFEFRLAPRMTLDIYGGGNLWKMPDFKTAKHLLAQPELRYWTCESFNGLFFGLHGHGAKYNVGGWDIPVGRLKTFKDARYEGYLYGGGLSLGNSWVVTPRLNIEASLGGGYARIDYRKYPCADCGTMIDENEFNYWGVTRATLSLIYFLK